jgi:CubicO group peptidase (beta-lactamase class C family)
VSYALPHSTPSEQGVDPAGITAFLDAVEAAPDIELHSLVIIRHGQVIAEGWWSPYGPDRVHLLYSLSKSFTSTAAGFAVAEGLVDLDAPVLSYFPELDAEITDPRSRSMRVRHVAAMASGHRQETLERAVRTDPHEPVRGFLLIPPDAEPGTIFAYNQPCTYTLAAIVQRVSGQSLSDYLRPRLFEPLGIQTYGWHQYPAGRDIGFSGLHATTDAVAKLGLLYLQRGFWNGERLLSDEWVSEATRRQVANPAEPNPDWRQGYGFQFWMARHGYRGDGAYGQLCVILPDQDMVIATTGDTENMQGVLDAIWAEVLPAVQGAGSAPTAADQALAERLASAALPTAPATDLPADPGAWHGRRFAAPASRVTGLRTLDAITLERSGEEWILRLVEAGGPITCRVGQGEWVISHDEDGAGEPSAEITVAATGGWPRPDLFRAEVIFLETPHRLRLECRQGDDTFRGSWRTTPLHLGPLAQLRMPVPGVGVSVGEL